MVAFAAVVAPGVLAGLFDDDPAGITTYSILGADFGYRLLWVLLLSTLALIVFHELCVPRRWSVPSRFPNTTTSSSPPLPIGWTSRPPAASCATSGGGTCGNAAATRIAS